MEQINSLQVLCDAVENACGEAMALFDRRCRLKSYSRGWVDLWGEAALGSHLLDFSVNEHELVGIYRKAQAEGKSSGEVVWTKCRALIKIVIWEEGVLLFGKRKDEDVWEY